MHVAHVTHNATLPLSDLTESNLSSYTQLPLEPHTLMCWWRYPLSQHIQAELVRGCYLLSFPPPEPVLLLAPATKNIFPNDPRPPLLAEAERQDC